jgi:putative DNA primase/helicase
MTTDAIQAAIRFGWPLIKLSGPADKGPSPGKRPIARDWQKRPGITADEAQAWLDADGNIGIRTGNGLLVVDCDGDAPPGLPPTITAQTGGGGVHLYYRVPPGTPKMRVGNTARHIHASTDTRGEGGQVVAPGSVHADTGALYEWMPGRAPDEIELADLPQWVIDAINTPPAKLNTAAPQLPLPATTPGSGYVAAALQRAAATVTTAPEGERNATLNREAYSLARLTELTDGEIINALLPAAVAAGLPERESHATLKSGITAGRQKPVPVPPPRAGRDAPRTGTAGPPQIPTDVPPRGASNSTGDPDQPNYVVTPSPRDLAEKFNSETHPGRTLRYWRGDWYIYDRTHYRVLDVEALHRQLSETLSRWHYYNDSDKLKTVRCILKDGLLRDVMSQLRGLCMLPARQEAPFWMDGTPRPSASEWISVRNGLLRLDSSREFIPHTPALFVTSTLPFAYSPDADSPETWVDFLTRTWPGDSGADCALLLGEWFGYCLSRDMSHHKMLWIIGPQRSGKGVISRTLEALMGPDSTCNPTLGSLGDARGGQVLIDMRLAIIADARLGRRNDQASIVERLLSLSGGDKQTVRRLYKPDWTGHIPLKIQMVSNELPNLTDASGALLGRLLMLQTTQSHLGREDRFLESKIRRELPGILNWALDGLQRLTTQGRFTEPAESRAILAGFRAVSAPITAFIEDRCTLDPQATVARDALYAAYLEWATDEGLTRPYGKAKFGQQLRAACAEIDDYRAKNYGARTRYYTGIKLE